MHSTCMQLKVWFCYRSPSTSWPHPWRGWVPWSNAVRTSNLNLSWNAHGRRRLALYLINLAQTLPLSRYKFPPTKSVLIQYTFPLMHPSAFAINSSACMSAEWIQAHLTAKCFWCADGCFVWDCCTFKTHPTGRKTTKRSTIVQWLAWHAHTYTYTHTRTHTTCTHHVHTPRAHTTCTHTHMHTHMHIHTHLSLSYFMLFVGQVSNLGVGWMASSLDTGVNFIGKLAQTLRYLCQ